MNWDKNISNLQWFKFSNVPESTLKTLTNYSASYNIQFTILDPQHLKGWNHRFKKWWKLLSFLFSVSNFAPILTDQFYAYMSTICVPWVGIVVPPPRNWQGEGCVHQSMQKRSSSEKNKNWQGQVSEHKPNGNIYQFSHKFNALNFPCFILHIPFLFLKQSELLPLNENWCCLKNTQVELPGLGTWCMEWSWWPVT